MIERNEKGQRCAVEIGMGWGVCKSVCMWFRKGTCLVCVVPTLFLLWAFRGDSARIWGRPTWDWDWDSQLGMIYDMGLFGLWVSGGWMDGWVGGGFAFGG